MRRFIPALMLLLSTPICLTAQKPDWKADIEARREALVKQNGPGTDVEMRDRLLEMKREDQEARGIHPVPAEDQGPVRVASNLAEIDTALTGELKEIVTEKGWPSIALVGLEASNAAMLVLTHTSDHEWQRSLLPTLEGLADTGRIDGSSLAFVIDKDLIAQGKLQRYGSQFKLVDGAMAMYAVEDPGGLDRRREQAMLPPIEEYEAQLMGIYHFKISKQIVMAMKAPVTRD